MHSIGLFSIPNNVLLLLSKLNDAGFDSWIVGGCVRDMLLGANPNDWDICTNALPSEMKTCFRNFHTIETGLKHGTLTVVVNHEPYEITTYRTDGTYTDHRHPDSVSFVDKLSLDLQRRDFTINAMAYHPEFGLVDEHGGYLDLKNQIIRCVGSAQLRFEEDALRILRAVRFASVLGFHIEPRTEASMIQTMPLLQDVARERIHVEMTKLLRGKAASEVLQKYPDLFQLLFPSLKRYPEKCLESAEAISRSESKEEAVLYAILFHAGKDESAEKTADIAEQEMLRLRLDKETIAAAKSLILYQFAELTAERSTSLRYLNLLQPKQLFRLIAFQKALNPSKKESLACFEAFSLHLINENACYSLKQLALNGTDLIDLGYPTGKVIGDKLNELLKLVISGQIENNREALLQALFADNSSSFSASC